MTLLIIFEYIFLGINFLKKELEFKPRQKFLLIFFCICILFFDKASIFDFSQIFSLSIITHHQSQEL